MNLNRRTVQALIYGLEIAAWILVGLEMLGAHALAALILIFKIWLWWSEAPIVSVLPHADQNEGHADALQRPPES